MKKIGVLLLMVTWLQAQEVQVGALEKSMCQAAEALLGCLDEGEKQQVQLRFDDADRTRWHYFPVEIHARKGLCFQQMTSEQRLMALGLLSSGLSREGFQTALGIMSMEDEVHRMEGGTGRFLRSSELYHVTIFGEPGLDSDWGWRIEGHHLSLNYTFKKGALVSCTPAFFGANPNQVKQGNRKGYSVLAKQNARARALLLLLAGRVEPLKNVPKDILTKAKPAVSLFDEVQELAGMSKTSGAALALVNSYQEIFPASCQSLFAKPSDGWSAAYYGKVELGEPHYYRVQSDDLILEYCNTQAGASHAHGVLRSVKGDFGASK